METENRAEKRTCSVVCKWWNWSSPYSGAFDQISHKGLLGTSMIVGLRKNLVGLKTRLVLCAYGALVQAGSRRLHILAIYQSISGSAPARILTRGGQAALPASSILPDILLHAFNIFFDQDLTKICPFAPPTKTWAGKYWWITKTFFGPLVSNFVGCVWGTKWVKSTSLDRGRRNCYCSYGKRNCRLLFH